MSLTSVLPSINWNDLIGLSTTLETARRRAIVAAQSDLPVLLLGEPGVGKETFARLIAQETIRSRQTFVKLSAKRLTLNDWDSLLALFVGEKPNVPFDELRDGVLYLVDVEKVPLEIQRRFATAFQTSTFAFRVLFGSSQSFLRSRKERAFDQEFEAFLSGYPIFLPPLRERKFDFSELCDAFFRQATDRLGVPSRTLTAHELQKLESRKFPENLDDLRRTLDVLAEKGELPQENSNNQDDVQTSKSFLTLDEAAKRHIEEALRRSKGVVEGQNGAAAALNINPYTLRARMRKLKLDWTKFRPEEEA